MTEPNPIASNRSQRRGAAFVRAAVFARAAARVLDRPDASLDVPARFMAETRAVQLAETLKLAKFSVMAHMLVAASFVPFFWATRDRDYVLVFCGLVSTLSLAAFGMASVLGPRISSPQAVARGRWVATAIAFLLGLVWASVPIALLPHSDEMHRLIVTNTMTGVIADIFVLGPILTVSVLFVLPVLTGIGIGLSLMGGFTGIVLLVLLGAFALFVLFSITEMNRLSVQRVVDRVRVSEQNDTIGLLLRDFEESTSDWLWETDADGLLHNASERIAQAVGVPADELRRQPMQALFSTRCPQLPVSQSARKVFTAIARRHPFHNVLVEIRTPGPSIWWRLTGKPVYDKGGGFAGYRGVGSDITIARNAEEKIAYMASYDALTGLANRAVFLNLASAECAAVRGEPSECALLFLDLDGFKGVNDSLGHVVGDRLLKDVAQRLQAGVPAGALLARLGGDEFAILCRVARRAAAETLAETLIARLSVPYQIEGSQADIGVSIGIAFAPGDCDHPDGLLVKADLALYRAKADGRGRYPRLRRRIRALAGRAAGLRGRPAAGPAARRAGALLPAPRRARPRPGRLLRGAAALAQRDARDGVAGHLHPGRRDDRAHRRDWPLGAAPGL